MAKKPTKKRQEAPGVKDLVWEGDSKSRYMAFPEEVHTDAGYQLGEVQKGKKARHQEGMPEVGAGAFDVKVDYNGAWFRILVCAKFGGKVHVLHAFQKKTNTTPKADIDLAKARYAAVKKRYLRHRRSDEAYDDERTD